MALGHLAKYPQPSGGSNRSGGLPGIGCRDLWRSLALDGIAARNPTVNG